MQAHRDEHFSWVIAPLFPIPKHQGYALNFRRGKRKTVFPHFPTVIAEGKMSAIHFYLYIMGSQKATFLAFPLQSFSPRRKVCFIVLFAHFIHQNVSREFWDWIWRWRIHVGPKKLFNLLLPPPANTQKLISQFPLIFCRVRNVIFMVNKNMNEMSISCYMKLISFAVMEIACICYTRIQILKITSNVDCIKKIILLRT